MYVPYMNSLFTLRSRADKLAIYFTTAFLHRLDSKLVSGMELMIYPIPCSDWWIFVGAVQTRDHYVVIRVIK